MTTTSMENDRKNPDPLTRRKHFSMVFTWEELESRNHSVFGSGFNQIRPGSFGVYPATSISCKSACKSCEERLWCTV
jgi:hypothetical protein